FSRDWSSDVCSSDLSTAHVADPAAAPALAAVIDRSPAIRIIGPTLDVEPLAHHLTRLQRTMTIPWVTAEPPVSLFGPPDDRTRRSEERRVGKERREG